jgi:hypothetical protein
MKQALINRLESILIAVGGAVPALPVPSNFRARSLRLAELILVQLGGSIPAAKVPDNYDSRILLILEQCLIAKAQTPSSPTVPIGNFPDRLLTLLGQLLVYGGGSIPPLATPTNFNARVLLLLDALLVVAPVLYSLADLYESRVIALGSTLPANRKTAIAAFITAIQGQSYFSKIKLLWLGCGPSSVAGLAAHLIHPTGANASLVGGFGAGNYNSSGAALGLKGIVGGYVDHNFAPLVGDITIFCYPTSLEAVNSADFSMGPTYSIFNLSALIVNWNNTNGYFFGSNIFNVTFNVSDYGAASSAFLLGTRNGTNNVVYINGVARASLTGSGELTASGQTRTFSQPEYASSTRRIALSGCGVGMSAGEVSHFSTQVATLVAALAT